MRVWGSTDTQTLDLMGTVCGEKRVVYAVRFMRQGQQGFNQGLLQ